MNPFESAHSEEGPPPIALRLQRSAAESERRMQECLLRANTIRSHGNYVLISCGSEHLRARGTLAGLEAVLPQSCWMRVHRLFMVRRDFIIGVRQIRGMGVWLTLGDTSRVRAGRKYERHVMRELTGPGRRTRSHDGDGARSREVAPLTATAAEQAWQDDTPDE